MITVWFHSIRALSLFHGGGTATDKWIFSPTQMRTEAHPGFLLIFNYSVTFTNVGVFAIS